MSVINIGISIIVGYLVGCFQTSYLVGKRMGHIDIRDFGSGNAGTTNVLRVMGKKAAVITFIGDFVKAVIPILVFRWLFNDLGYGLIAGVAAVAGHNWPVFLQFRGGKGIAATIGLCFGFNWQIGIIISILMFVVIKLSKYVSLGSILMVLSLPLLVYLFYGLNLVYLGATLVLAFFGVFRHKDNIKRLLNGTEKKIGHNKEILNKTP